MIGSPAPKAERQAVLVGYGVKLGTTSRRARKTPGGRAAAPAAPAAATAPAPPAGRGTPEPRLADRSRHGARALAKPPVRKMARDLGVDLGGLAGTGPARLNHQGRRPAGG